MRLLIVHRYCDVAKLFYLEESQYRNALRPTVPLSYIDCIGVEQSDLTKQA